MTSLLRRKRRITVHVLSMPALMVASLVGLGLLLAGLAATAQESSFRNPASKYFSRSSSTTTTEKSTVEEPPPVSSFGYSKKPERRYFFRKEPTPSSSTVVAPEPPPVLSKGGATIKTIVPSANMSYSKSDSRKSDAHKDTKSESPKIDSDGSVIQRTVMQQPRDAGKAPGEEGQEVQIQLDPPGPEKVFQRDSEASFQERLRQERRARGMERIYFPDEPVVSKEPYKPRAFPLTTEFVEPSYVCYGRLLFEDKNSERYGWDLGFIQPFVSASIFYWDVATLPYHIYTSPCRWYECSAGYCLPGDPVPYMLYPPEISVPGSLMEIGTIVALFAIFPG